MVKVNMKKNNSVCCLTRLDKTWVIAVVKACVKIFEQVFWS